MQKNYKFKTAYTNKNKTTPIYIYNLLFIYFDTELHF